jgi:hypothetical protein
LLRFLLCLRFGSLPNGVNGFFENCPAQQALMYLQMAFSFLFNGFLIAIIIARIANSENRAVQVVFSNKAIVSLMGGQVRFQVRVFDVDSRLPVVEAHVRLYAVTKERPVPRPLRIIQPNDELNAMLFLSLPQVICHHIDLHSILHPSVPNNPLTEICNGLTLRQADSTTCNREEVVCPVCGENFGTHERWVNHVRYQQIIEEVDKIRASGSHLGVSPQDLEIDRYKPTHNLQQLKDHFEQEISEVIVVVEGINPLTSGTFAALHSYQADDIVWDHSASFHPCVIVEEDIFRVDLDRFHDILTHSSRRHQQMSIRYHDAFFRGAQEQGSGKPLIVPPRLLEDGEED